MAVTITIAKLVAALRLGDSSEELAEATRLHAFCSEAITKYAPLAPSATSNEALRRMAGYLFDQPESSRGDAYANALRNSGAARILLPYRIHRAGYADAVEAAQAAVGTTGNPVVDVSVNGAELVVTFADGTTETHDLPAGGMGGVDQTARDGATNAQNAADAAQGEIDAHETSEHNTDSTARGAAAQTQTELDTHEASTHNTDSVARSTAVNARQVGESAQTTADTARTDLTAHEATPHGGGTDQTARDAAAAAQADVDAHEASTHNTDAGARTGAANAQTFAQDHAASTHNTDGTARAAAAAQSELDDHEASTHNTDTAARDAAQAAQGAANAAQTTADGKIDADAANALIAAHTHQPDATRYAATFGLLTDLAAGTWESYTSGLDAGELFKHGAFAVATAAGRDKLAVPTTGVYSIKAMVVGIIDLGGSTDRAWLEARLVRNRGGVEVAQAPVGILGYARNQLGTAAQTLTSAVDGFFELEANDEIHLEAMLSSQDVNNLLDLTSGYLGLVKF